MMGRGPWVAAPGSGQKPRQRFADRCTAARHSCAVLRKKPAGNGSPRRRRATAIHACGNAGYAPVSIKTLLVPATKVRQNKCPTRWRCCTLRPLARRRFQFRFAASPPTKFLTQSTALQATCVRAARRSRRVLPCDTQHGRCQLWRHPGCLL